MRGVARVLDISRHTFSRWLVEHIVNLPHFRTSILPVQPMMYWNWTSCGHLWATKVKNAGYGWPYAAVPVRSWLMSSVTAAAEPVGNCGYVFQPTIASVVLTAIFGTPMSNCSVRVSTRSWARTAVKPLTSNAGIVH